MDFREGGGEPLFHFSVTRLESWTLRFLLALHLARNSDLEKAPGCLGDCASGFAGGTGTQGELILLAGIPVELRGAGRRAIVLRSQDVL